MTYGATITVVTKRPDQTPDAEAPENQMSLSKAHALWIEADRNGTILDPIDTSKVRHRPATREEAVALHYGADD